MLGIIGAMDMEVEQLLKEMTDVTEKTVGFTKFYAGKLFSVPVCLARCGIGKVHAALCAQAMILEYEIDAMLNIGVAGALLDSLNIAHIVVAKSAVQHDIDTTPFGDPLGMISGPNIVHIPCDEKLSSLLEEAAREAELPYACAAIATGDQFIAELSKKDFLADHFGAGACDMEGGAIAQCCYEMQIPYAACRAISDTRSGNEQEYIVKAREACRAEEKLLRCFAALYLKEKEQK